MQLFTLKRIAIASAFIVGSASVMNVHATDYIINSGNSLTNSTLNLSGSGDTLKVESTGSLTSTIDLGRSLLFVDETMGQVTSGGNTYSIINNGTISITGTNSSGKPAVTINSGASLPADFINNGIIQANDGVGITVYGQLTGQLFNTGSIGGLVVDGIGSSVGSIYNAPGGVIAGGAFGIYMSGTGTSIGTITNLGAISGGSFGILVDQYSTAVLTTLNNSQGSAGALKYDGKLPTNYNIIINSPTSFGKLDAGSTAGIAGTTTFGIYSGSTVTNGTYASVLSGFTSSNLSATSGSFGSATWLLSNSSGTIWDLIITGYLPPPPSGPSTVDTQQSLVNTASVLQGTFVLQNSVLANSFSYDCTVFGANNVCVSAGGRNTAVQAANGLNNTSGLLIAAYRPHANYRIGAYADQNLSVNNAGSTVNLGNNTPLIGIFGAWNERLDGTGTEVKVTAAYGQKNTTINRAVVGSGATASEAGAGGSQLNSQGAQVVAKYGFGVMPDVVVSPYAGIRYTQNNMGGYTEASSSAVTAPLTYSALNTNATTALAGVGASYKGIPQTNLFASAGVEIDTNTANGSVNATGVSGLTPVNFNPNPVKTRPTAMLGASYDVAKNQRLGVTGIYRQEAYQAVSTTTVMATYTIGL